MRFETGISEERKAELLASCLFFCSPSRFEGFGIAALEANAAGCAVLATDVDGFRDSLALGETALAVPPNDPSALKTAMIRLIQDALAPRVRGQSIFEGERIWESLFALTHASGERKLLREAIACVDCALWDLKGRHLGQPVYRLLGGPTRESVPAYASCLGFSVDPERAAAFRGRRVVVAVVGTARRSLRGAAVRRQNRGVAALGGGAERDVLRISAELADKGLLDLVGEPTS